MLCRAFSSLHAVGRVSLDQFPAPAESSLIQRCVLASCISRPIPSFPFPSTRTEERPSASPGSVWSPVSDDMAPPEQTTSRWPTLPWGATAPKPPKRPYSSGRVLDDIPSLSYALHLFLASQMVESEEFCKECDPNRYAIHFESRPLLILGQRAPLFRDGLRPHTVLQGPDVLRGRSTSLHLSEPTR